MLDFIKIKYKFVGALLFHVSPHCTIVLLYENEESPSLQAMYDSIVGGEAPFQVLSPRQGRQNVIYTSLACMRSKNLVHFPNLNTTRSRAVEFSWTSRFQNLELHTKILDLEAFH